MTPLVSVIVPHHLPENDEYLRWCLKSIVSSRNVELEVICISDSVNGCPDHLNPGGVRMIWDDRFTNLTKKWNHGLEISNPESKYVMLISDDVMVAQDTIVSLAEVADYQRAILSPGSNCDSTTRFYTQYFAGPIPIPHKCTLQDIKGHESHVIERPLTHPFLIDPGWISFYCTLFPRTVLNEVGSFDERLDVRYNDVDYCQRARALGIPSLIHLGCFALHFGDRTLPKCTTEAEYKAADLAYQEKYQPLPGLYDLVIPEENGDLL